MKAHAATVNLSVTFTGVIPVGGTHLSPEDFLKNQVRMMNLEIRGFVQTGKNTTITVSPEPIEVPT
tara:strand:+ start:3224 stop:3421 length:198 start_codon:yes stop_codon:yes gene_type:complete